MSDLGTACSFIPPYLLVRLATTGAMDADVADATLLVDGRIRARRTEGALGAVAAIAERWIVHDAQQGTGLPGTQARAEGQAETGDVSVDEAASGITATLDLYREVYGRESFDDRGATALLTVHYGRNYANAFWDGTHLVFGDGDGRVFGRFTAALDVLAHEFSHAVTERTTGLIYRDQSGALNESMSDVFGACVKQRELGQDASSGDWLIGDGIFAPGIGARALRDMANPGTAYDDPQLGKDPQPGHMDDFVVTGDDNGGVHINSGIPNRAFVLAALAVGGSTAEGAGRIWYSALTSGDVRPDSDFVAFADATVAQAGEHAEAVRAAWEEVGVQPTSAPAGDSAAGNPAIGNLAAEGTTTGDPTIGGPTTEVVAVRRTGGFVGQALEGSVDLASADPRVPQVRNLMAGLDFTAATASPPQPDRYVYDFRVGNRQIQVPEQDLTPELSELAGVVLDDEG